MRSIAGVVLFLLVLGGTLTAGLWPFNPLPANEASWIKNRNGLLLTQNALVVGSGSIKLPNPGSSFVSLEIWIKPFQQWKKLSQQWDTKMLFSICAPGNPLEFQLLQYRDNLLVKRRATDPKGQLKEAGFKSEPILYPENPVFITITSGVTGTTFYANGERENTFHNFRLTQHDLSGQLVLGTSPVEDLPWRGEIMGLAIYASELSSDQVMAHYRAWTHNHPVDIAQESNLSVLYDFHEQSGRIIHDLRNGGVDLVIPKHYSVPHKIFLERPWNEFRLDWSYAEDMIENVLGFVPLGISACAFFAYALRLRAKQVTILLGMATSATIEVLQAFIPSRNSGFTDILTNTAGTLIGVFLYSQPEIKDLWNWLVRTGADFIDRYVF